MKFFLVRTYWFLWNENSYLLCVSHKMWVEDHFDPNRKLQILHLKLKVANNYEWLEIQKFNKWINWLRAIWHKNYSDKSILLEKNTICWWCPCLFDIGKTGAFFNFGNVSYHSSICYLIIYKLYIVNYCCWYLVQKNTGKLTIKIFNNKPMRIDD